jgi:hypothetical protein
MSLKCRTVRSLTSQFLYCNGLPTLKAQTVSNVRSLTFNFLTVCYFNTKLSSVRSLTVVFLLYVVSTLQARKVALLEPGFHYILPALLDVYGARFQTAILWARVVYESKSAWLQAKHAVCNPIACLSNVHCLSQIISFVSCWHNTKGVYALHCRMSSAEPNVTT